MNIREKIKTTQFRLFLVLCISTVFVIAIIILMNNISLEQFYKYSKIGTAKSIYESLNKYYNEEKRYDITDYIKQVEIKNNMEILIENEFYETLYSSSKGIISSVENLKNTSQVETIYKNSKIEIKNIDTSSVNKYMMLESRLDNGYLLYIKIPVMPIQESVKVSNRILIYIGIMTIIVSGSIYLLISKKFTEPIIQLNRITKKMAKLDFNEKYVVSDTDYDINELGKNINEMSEKLERTITQLRKNNDELEKDIEEKSKIDEMRKQFISDVSHELKTPISLIQGYAEGLLENVNKDEDSRKFYAEVIIDESKKMDNMVKQLLELMKLEYQEKKMNDIEFDLNEMIEEEIRRQTVILNDNKIQIDFENKKKNIVYADQECIERVFNNYFTNAIKHCETIDGEKKISIRTEKRKNGKLRLFVYNTGKNISEEHINKIWNRFYKLDSSRNREYGGTGIGLALAKAVMNNYGNEYGVKNFKNGVEFFCDINTKNNSKKEENS